MFYVLVQRVKGQEHQGKYDNNNNNFNFWLTYYIPTTYISFHENCLIVYFMIGIYWCAYIRDLINVN